LEKNVDFQGMMEGELHRFTVQGFTVHGWRVMKIESRLAGKILWLGAYQGYVIETGN
jgi:hypothetical protein